MSQDKFLANITAAAFPLVTDWATRTVLQTRLPEGKSPITIPQIMFCENVLPTVQGYKTVSYKDLIAPVIPATVNFDKVFTVYDNLGAKGLIGVGSDSKIYLITSSSYVWVDVTPVGWTGTEVTHAVVNGNSYIFLKQFGCYLVNITAVTITVQVLIGITVANIYGILSAVNYLILWDATALYWSSTINPLDFGVSLITGAGSESPSDLTGKIIFCAQLATGFAIYSTANIVIAAFSNNTQFPWIYKGSDGSSGILNSSQVGYAENAGHHIVITSAGLLQVKAELSKGIVPEVSDFLAAKIYESYNFSTHSVTRQKLDKIVLTRIVSLSARYLALSYGIASYTDILIYDLLLERWGKLHVDHISCFEIKTPTDVVPHPYNEASEIGQTYASASPESYNAVAASFDNAPEINTTLGIVLNTGALKQAYLKFDSNDDNAVLVLGKFQALRNYELSIEGVEVESISAADTSFKLLIASSINGKDSLPAVELTYFDQGIELRTFHAHNTGKNHNLIFEGSFNLTAVEIVYKLDGRR